MNTQKYFFIRHGQLVPPYLNHLTMDYDTLADLSTSTLNPDINENAVELFVRQTTGVDFSDVQTVYYNNSGSQSRRSDESAKLIQKMFQDKYQHVISLIGLPELREVRFDVRKLLSANEFKRMGMPAVRAALYAKQVSGHGYSESLTEMERRIKQIKRIIKKQSKGDMLFVTHDFFMRAIEVFITRPQRLTGATVLVLEKTGLNYYFGGFQTDRDMHAFCRWGKSI